MITPDDLREAFDEGFALSKLGGPIGAAWDRSNTRQIADEEQTVIDVRRATPSAIRLTPAEASDQFGYVAPDDAIAVDVYPSWPPLARPLPDPPAPPPPQDARADPGREIREGGRRPPFPPNRILREGERPCPTCGHCEREHRGGVLGHAFLFTRLQRAAARLLHTLWPTRRTAYILGKVDRPW